MLHYQARPDCLHQRVILVTGAGQGIGLQAALSFAQHGATVILLGRTLAKLEAAYDTIMQQGWPEPLIFVMDLQQADNAAMQAMATGIAQQLGRLDGVLHNASQLDALAPLMLASPAQWQQLWQVNVLAPWMLTKACLPLLQQAPDASVLFTSHHSARALKPFWGMHAISKRACDDWMQLHVQECPAHSPVRFNSIIPGPVQSPQRKKTHPGEIHAQLPEAQQLMPWYLYLMGPDSIGVSGQILDAQQTALECKSVL